MINLKIKTKNISLTDSLAEYIKKRTENFDKLISRVGQKLQAELEIGRASQRRRKDPQIFYTKLNLQLPQKKIIRSEAHNIDLRMAIDELKDKTERQLKKYKSKKLVKANKKAKKAKELTRSAL